MRYDKRWNKHGAMATMILQTTDHGGIIKTQNFMDEEGFSEAYAFLAQEKNRWYKSDQFVGRGLEIVVL